MSKPKILVIVGTVRQGRSGLKIANWYVNEAKKLNLNVDLEIYDIAELNLPLFNEAVPPAYHQYNEVQTKIAAKIGAADGFVFITAEYNHSVAGSLVNFLNHINAEWDRKVAAFVGYGSAAGARAVEHLIQIIAELGVASLGRGANLVGVRAPWEALDEQGIPKKEYVVGDIGTQLKELIWWADALKAARTKA